jgi:hypothetical protein
MFSMIPTPKFKRVVKRRHRIYQHREIDDVLEYLSLPLLERGAITKIARDTAVPVQTLRNWRSRRRLDKNWFPLDRGHLRARAFSERLEEAIADFL